ncbi:MAG: spore maturation protein [Oscillospiraceae bacterium]|nr:spore maturation protein [Oscillospiraceae bacterium]
MSSSLTSFTAYLIPSVVVIILLFGMVKRVPVFETFLAGAKEGLHSCVSILPSLIGLLMAVHMLQASGALDLFTQWITPLATQIGFPPEVTPLLLLRPVSGSGSTAILTQIFDQCGPDSLAGWTASVMAGSTETTFYAIAVYYGAVGIKKTRHTIPAALLADFACGVFAVLTTRLFFGQ